MALLVDSRGAWDARAPLRANTVVAWAQRSGVSWHWIGPGKGPSRAGSHAHCLEQVREWQRQHQAKGWKDIGYNVLICQHARAIEGRGLTVSGSHSPGVNYAHLGVQFMVGEDDPPPSAAMLARAVRLRTAIGELGQNIRRDWPHKADPEASTECPGPWITSWVRAGGPTKRPAEGSGDSVPKPVPTPAPKPKPQPIPISEEPDVYLVKHRDRDEVWKSDGFKRVAFTSPQNLEDFRRGHKATTGRDLPVLVYWSDAELAQFGPIVTSTQAAKGSPA